MRTTVDLPDGLYRALKARAALRGVTVRALLQGLIEQSLRGPGPEPAARRGRAAPPPVIVPPRGVPIGAAEPSAESGDAPPGASSASPGEAAGARFTRR